jgi:hypothetical protein
MPICVVSFKDALRPWSLPGTANRGEPLIPVNEFQLSKMDARGLWLPGETSTRVRYGWESVALGSAGGSG